MRMDKDMRSKHSTISLAVASCLCWLAGGMVLAESVTVGTWQATEITLSSAGEYQNPFEDVEVTATFSGPGGKTLTRPAFWDGGKTWKIRFAPTAVGEWVMRTESKPADAGLHDQRRTITAVAYDGPHAIYRHGFLRASDNGRYLAYADGTPFFFLGEMHAILPHERFTTSNVPGIASQFKHIIDTRVRQGFTVANTEPIWVGHKPGAKPGDPHTGADEEPAANLYNGMSEEDLPGFANLDRKYAYIAEQGLVHANCSLEFVHLAHYPIATTDYMTRLARYWVARYGAYPVIWTIAQEVDGSYPQDPRAYDKSGVFSEPKATKEQNEAAMAKWLAVGDVTARNDAYGQPVMPYMASYQWPDKSWWRNKPYHTGWFIQWSHYFGSGGTAWAKTFWNHNPPKPAFAETKYDAFESNNHSTLLAAYKFFQHGIFGYSYGVGGIWNDLYSRTPLDVGSAYLAEKSATWHEGLKQKTGDQLTLWKTFYTSLAWWKLEPRFDDPAWSTFTLEPKNEVWLATISNQIYVVCFAGKSLATGQLLKMDDMAQYTARWFNSFDGAYTEVGAIRSTAGAWTIPNKPSEQDWVLLVQKK